MAEQGWHADPTGRHELRYWNGGSWTDHVSNRGVTSTDPLVPAPPVVASAPPAWQADPTGRHELRYWNGTAWTDNVSDRGVTGLDPLTAPTAAASDASPPVSAAPVAAAPIATAPVGAPPVATPAPVPVAPAVQPAPPVPSAPVVPSRPKDTSLADLAGGTSGLLYLSASKVLPKASGPTAVTLPCGTATALVSRRQLAGTLAAAAIFDLREAGLVTFEVSERQGMFGRTDERVTLRRANPGATAPGWGVVLLDAIGDDAAAEVDVRELISDWVGKMMTDPYGFVLGHAEAELVARGVMTYTDGRNPVEHVRSGSDARADTAVDCPKAKALKTERDAAVARWKAALTDSEELHSLVEECSLAVQGRELHS